MTAATPAPAPPSPPPPPTDRNRAALIFIGAAFLLSVGIIGACALLRIQPPMVLDELAVALAGGLLTAYSPDRTSALRETIRAILEEWPAAPTSPATSDSATDTATAAQVNASGDTEKGE